MDEDVWKDKEEHETYIPCTCHRCGKTFFPPLKNSWVYKRGSKSNRSESGTYLVFFCSWGCMRQYDRDNAHVYSRRGRKKVTA